MKIITICQRKQPHKTTEGGGEPIGEYPSERLMYYYHPDYLGNVEYITDMDGLPYQYFSYTPWGEEFKSDIVTPNSWDSPYRFNGKELDEETGLYYYGARYYNPSTSVWLSVDAMASKGPNITPYAFSHNNPVMLVDPDGNWPEGTGDDVLINPNLKNSWSFEMGVVSQPIFQRSGNFRLNGKNIGTPSNMQFYALNENQSINPFTGNDPTDQGNYYYGSMSNKETGLTFTAGITHDKQRASKVSQNTFDYESGGMELTFMAGKRSTGGEWLGGKLQTEYRGGGFLSLNKLNVNVQDSQNNLITSNPSGRQYSGFGLIGGGAVGINWNVGKHVSLSVGASAYMYGGQASTGVSVNGISGSRLSANYFGVNMSPYIKIGF